jgi:hypothetical protein
MTVHACEVPPLSLLARHVAAGAYADCYVTALPAAVTQAKFVEAFYTTRLFRLERWLLGRLMARPSTDAEARQLAAGQSASFAAWTVESRAENELVLAAGRTRSWLRVEAGSGTGAAHTLLFFGSAVLPRRSASAARGGMGFAFNALLGFHRLYSRALLASARARLARQVDNDAPSPT